MTDSCPASIDYSAYFATVFILLNKMFYLSSGIKMCMEYQQQHSEYVQFGHSDAELLALHSSIVQLHSAHFIRAGES